MVLGLFHAFQYPCVPIETGFSHFETWWNHAIKRHDGIVAKRDASSIFCNNISYMEQIRQLNFIKKHDIEIVHVIRNKEDVLKSENGYVSEERYDAVVQQAVTHSSSIKYTISYDEILFDPIGMQYTLATELGLDVVHMWDEYPDFVPLMVGSSSTWPTRRLGASKEGG